MRQERSGYDRDRIGKRDQSAHLAIVAFATRWGCLPSGREGIICRVVEKPASRTTRARPIAERLAGKNVLLTGVTGFLGQAIFERLLKAFPDTRITLLVRPQLGSSGRQRVESILGRPTFNALRDEVGGDGIKPLLDLRGDGGFRPTDRRGFPDDPARCRSFVRGRAGRQGCTPPWARLDRLCRRRS